MSDSVAKYEAWAGEINAQLAAYTKLRKQVRFFPLFGLAMAPIGLFWAPWVAIVIFLGWIALWGTTLYITYMRTWQYRNELARTRVDMAHLRDTAEPDGSRSP